MSENGTETRGDMVQVHLLTAYPAALLNRDDANLAKRLPFGGVVRTRVSSQCLKKHWREAAEVNDLGPLAVRSARVFRRVADALAPKGDADRPLAEAIARTLMKQVMQTSGDPENSERPLETKQVIPIHRAEADFLIDVGRELKAHFGSAEALPKDGELLKAIGDDDLAGMKALVKFKGLKSKSNEERREAFTASLDTALFGRMVTSDLLASRIDAAVSVAHAFTTHAEAAETDYFTAVDTLKEAAREEDPEAEDAGAGLIQDSELTSGVFYLYAVIDMNQLRNNLIGYDDGFADRLARQLVRAMATVSPGAKRGSTAPYAYAELVLLERGPEQPRTLANAFLKPVTAGGDGLMQASVEQLLTYRAGLARLYGTVPDTAVLATIHNTDAADGVQPVDTLAQALEAVLPATQDQE